MFAGTSLESKQISAEIRDTKTLAQTLRSGNVFNAYFGVGVHTIVVVVVVGGGSLN